MGAKKVHDVVTVASVTTVAGAVNANIAAVRVPRGIHALSLVLNVTAAATDNADTLDVKVQTMLDGTNWVDVCYFTQVLGDGGAKKHVAKIAAGVAQAMFSDTALTAGNVRNLLGDEYRVNYVQADADSDAEFTFTVTACPM